MNEAAKGRLLALFPFRVKTLLWVNVCQSNLYPDTKWRELTQTTLKCDQVYILTGSEDNHLMCHPFQNQWGIIQFLSIFVFLRIFFKNLSPCSRNIGDGYTWQKPLSGLLQFYPPIPSFHQCHTWWVPSGCMWIIFTGVKVGFKSGRVVTESQIGWG